MLMCLQCERFCVYDNPRCGLPECQFVDIDELAIPWIIELNKKGYKTQYCCSGHIYECGVYTYCMSVAISGKDVSKLFRILSDNSIFNDHFTAHINYWGDFASRMMYTNLRHLNEITDDDVYTVQLELQDEFEFKDQKDYQYKLDCIHNANKLFYNLAKSLPYFNDVK